MPPPHRVMAASMADEEDQHIRWVQQALQYREPLAQYQPETCMKIRDVCKRHVITTTATTPITQIAGRSPCSKSS